MKKPLFVAVMAVGVVALAGMGVASAQDVTAVSHVPFAFVVGGHQMAAGDYRVLPDPNMENVVQIVSRDGRSEAFSIVQGAGVDPKGTQATLEFKKVGGVYMLWRVSIPGRDVFELPVSLTRPAQQELAKTAAAKAHRGDD